MMLSAATAQRLGYKTRKYGIGVASTMISRDVTIINASGLHARPATFFIQKANSFRSTIWVEKEDRRVNAKSLLGVLSLGIAKGMTITLIADGQDEQAALDGLSELIDSGFNG